MGKPTVLVLQLSLSLASKIWHAPNIHGIFHREGENVKNDKNTD